MLDLITFILLFAAGVALTIGMLWIETLARANTASSFNKAFIATFGWVTLGRVFSDYHRSYKNEKITRLVFVVRSSFLVILILIPVRLFFI